ncbi:MAG TPA: hypothetical protein PKC13_21375 [Blastocatellia bacterium]|nr:hypothetical protein [Blastocatellia bacterium]HMX28154.1 hypothetical protein [Blastocatellia bacterium]HMY76943.1 hypothetical protein [Blastocatellia bacterium]HNG30691.1 hypothetical protein [Blastocatellia bacterium]
MQQNKQAKLVKRGTVTQEPPPQPQPQSLPVITALKKALTGRLKTAEAARTDARMAFEALFARA